MSVEEWINKEDAIPGGVITIPTKEQIEKRNAIMNRMISLAREWQAKVIGEETSGDDSILQKVNHRLSKGRVKAREMKRRFIKERVLEEAREALKEVHSCLKHEGEFPHPGEEDEPVSIVRMVCYFRVIPIKRKLNRYSKRYMRRFCMRAIPVQFEND